MRHRQAVRQGTLTPPSQVRLLLAQLKKARTGCRKTAFCAGFLVFAEAGGAAYSSTRSRLILKRPLGVTLCRPFLSKRQLVVPAFAADDGGAFQCGEDAAVGGAGAGRSGCRVKIGNVIHCPPWVGFHPQYARTSVERLWL